MAIELFYELLRWSQKPNLKYWCKFVIDFSVYWGRPNGTRWSKISSLQEFAKSVNKLGLYSAQNGTGTFFD